MLNDKIINLKPYSSTVLALAGLLLAGMGLYFIFIRPPYTAGRPALHGLIIAKCK